MDGVEILLDKDAGVGKLNPNNESLPITRNNSPKKEKVFENISEEIAYYRTKYKKYKEKFLTYKDLQTKLRQEYSELNNTLENIKDELKSEKTLRKKFEEKVINFMKFEQVKDLEKYSNYNKKPSEDVLNTGVIHDREKESFLTDHNLFRIDLNHFNPKDKNFVSSQKQQFLNNNCSNMQIFPPRESEASIDNFLRSSEIKKSDSNLNLKSSSISGYDGDLYSQKSDNIGQEEIGLQNKNDTNMTSTNLKERTLKEITNKFDVDKLKRSLTIDFIEYDRDTLVIRRKTVSREDKLSKLEKILKVWIEISENLRKSIDTVTNSMNIFTENFVQEPLDIFEECPDLISLIYTLQSVINDMISQFKIFSVSIENSFILQMKNFLNQSIQELKESKQSLIKHTDDFNYVSSKFLSTKKSYIKESMKDNYMSTYKLLEFTRYDYIWKINQCLLFTKIELPEKISLLIYAFMSLFRQGNEILNKIEYNVNANLEKVSVKYKEKEKIVDEVRRSKKDLIKAFDAVNQSIESKEGFLYVKTKDTNEYFKKRYFKIHNGNLVYFKLKKGTDQIDLSNHYTLCNLVLSNAKRNEKEYDFPFCFELISATNKKSFILQGETEKEAEEWVCAIRNAIASSISAYKNQSPKKDNDLAYLMSDSYSEKSDSKKDNMIDKLVSSNKCTDCEADSPTWCSINWLCLICIDCSGVHRSLGVQISKIRSLRLDNLEPELIDVLDVIGQDKINSILECGVKSYEKPKPNSMFSDKEVYITNKYKFKKYMRLPVSKSGDVNYPLHVFKYIENDSLISIYHLLKMDLCEINKLYDCEKEKYSFLHHSAKKGKVNAFKLLFLLGADLQQPDVKNLKPIDYATIYKNVSKKLFNKLYF
jgi:hypothetical protein